MLKSLIFAFAVSAIPALAIPASAEQPQKAADHESAASASAVRSEIINQTDRAAIRTSVETFIWGLSHGQSAPVWELTAEVLQKRLKNEKTALISFSHAHPQLANAQTLSFDGVRMFRDVPVAGFYVKDKSGRQWFALFAIARRGDGTFKVANCTIFAAPGVLI